MSHFLRPAFSMNGTVIHAAIAMVVVTAPDKAEAVSGGRARYFSNTVTA